MIHDGLEAIQPVSDDSGTGHQSIGHSSSASN